ncbi:MAG: UbiD family decarboxylase, partial [Halobacteriales archaeon]|nr:UbiD family decarboxylase [Halobacteriales archaeon]
MPWESFRHWIERLQAAGDLIEIADSVSTEYEIAAYIKKTCLEAGPAVRFSDVEGYDIDVVGGLYGAKHRILSAFDVDTHVEAVTAYGDRLDTPIEPTVVSDGPVREVVDTDPDLFDLPIVKHSEHDAGHYITAGTVVANLPHTGVRGQGMCRMLRRGRDELTIFAPAERRIGYAYRANYERRGDPTEIAVVIGCSPEVTLGSIASVPHNVDKYAVAGGLRGAPVELVGCETVDLEVPANAEMVIEGTIRPDREVTEAPFGEFAGCYSGEG